MVYFANKLKELRKQSGLTQKQLADKIGVTTQTVSYYENQYRIPSPEMLIKLAQIFNVSADYLLGINNEKFINISDLDDEEIQYVLNTIQMLRNKNKKTNSGMK